MRQGKKLFVIFFIAALANGCKKSPELATDSVPLFNGNVEVVVSKTSFLF